MNDEMKKINENMDQYLKTRKKDSAFSGKDLAKLLGLEDLYDESASERKKEEKK